MNADQLDQPTPEQVTDTNINPTPNENTAQPTALSFPSQVDTEPPTRTNQPITEPTSPNSLNAPAPAVAPSQPASFTNFSDPSRIPTTSLSPGTKKSHKKLWIIVGGIVAVLALVTGYVFLFYLPNTPDTVYNIGISRTGTIINGLVESATAPSGLVKLEATTVKGTAKVKIQQQTYKGSFSSNFDNTSSDSNLNVDLTNEAGEKQTLKVKVISEVAAASLYPAIYLQVSGLKAFDLEYLLPTINNYEGKWIYVSPETFNKSGLDTFGLKDNANEKPTAKDYAELAKAVSSTSKNYLFSTDPQKAVFTKKSYVGAEKTDGVDTYHYTVTINPVHATAYCAQLHKAVQSTSAFKKIARGAEPQTDKEVARNCQYSGKDDSGKPEEFELWIDRSHKIIHKIRGYRNSDKSTYYELGQTFKDNSKLSLFARYNNTKDKDAISLTVDSDATTLVTTAKLSAKSGNDLYSVDLSLESTPAVSPIKVTKPTSFVKVEELLDSSESQ